VIDLPPELRFVATGRIEECTPFLGGQIKSQSKNMFDVLL
jgi:hypothetical protein